MSPLPSRLVRASLALATTLVATACAATMGGPAGKPTPRYIDVACTKGGDQVVARARELLQQAGWTVTLVAVQPPEVEASRAAVYLGAGENLIASGPYRFDLTYPTGQVRMLVETVRVYPDGRAEHGRYHGDDSPAADKRQFESIVTGMRSFCGAT
jgi:hypothetical protein